MSYDVGSVPGINSSLVVGQYLVGSRPVVAQTVASSNPGGRTNCSTGLSFKKYVINWFHTGAAPEIPDTFFMAVLSVLPIHTPMTTCGV